MYRNVQNSEIMIIGGKQVYTGIDIKIGNSKMRHVHNLKCLRAMTEKGGKMNLEINNRVVIANKICYTLLKTFIRTKEVSRRTKIKIYNTVFVPTLLYGSEN